MIRLIANKTHKFLSLVKLYTINFLTQYMLFDFGGICRVLHVPVIYKRFNRIEEVKNIHKDKRCFIVATGPSLTVEDVELIKDEITFGVNSGFKIYNQIENYKPTYYACTDPINFNRMSEEYNWELESMCKKYFFVNHESVKNIKKMKKSNNYINLPISALDHLIHSNSTKFRFSKNLLWGVYGTYTVVNVAIQVAAYMGIKDIYLIGVDCNYTVNNPYAFEDSTKEWMKNEAYDIKRNRELAMIQGYRYINSRMKELGVNVYNATRGGNLEVFDRVKLEDVL